MKITSILALSALMTIGANAQTTLYSQNFDGVTFVNPTANPATRGLFGNVSAPLNSAGETALDNIQTAALGLAGIVDVVGEPATNASVKGVGDVTWNGVAGVTASNVLAINGPGAINSLDFSLAAGQTMTVSFDHWGVFSNNTTSLIYFAGNQVGSSIVYTTNGTRVKQTFTGTFANTTGSAITGAFQIDNGGNFVMDNILVTSAVTVPEPSAALLGAFGALALLRRRR